MICQGRLVPALSVVEACRADGWDVAKPPWHIIKVINIRAGQLIHT